MPFKRTDYPEFWYIDRRLPGFGKTGRLSTGVRDKRLAISIERMLDRLAERALSHPQWRDVLEAIKERRVALVDVYGAQQRGQLDQLLRQLSDPLLSDAVEVFVQAAKLTPQNERALETLLRLAPAGARLSYVADGKRITALLRQREREGVLRNTVRRQLMRSISKLVRHHYGNAERQRIFADVQFPQADDRRDVHLSPAEIKDLLSAARFVGGDELVAFLRMTMQTSADRGVLLEGQARRYHEGLRVRDVEIYVEEGRYSGQVYFRDRKSKGRSRTVGLTHGLCDLLLPLCQGKQPEAAVFNISYSGVDNLWQRTRRRAGLEHVRIKDLRHQLAQYGTKTGVPLAVLSKGMGHTQIGRTADYAAYSAVFDVEHAERVEREMGLSAA